MDHLQYWHSSAAAAGGDDAVQTSWQRFRTF